MLPPKRPTSATRESAPAPAPAAADTGYDRDDRADPTLRAALVAVGVAAIVLTVGAAFGFGPPTAVGVAVGGAIAFANLAVFIRVGRAFLERKNTVSWGMIAVVKLVVLVGGVWMLIRNGAIAPLALAAGYGAMPLGITFGVLFGPKPPEEGAPPPPPPG